MANELQLQTFISASSSASSLSVSYQFTGDLSTKRWMRVFGLAEDNDDPLSSVFYSLVGGSPGFLFVKNLHATLNLTIYVSAGTEGVQNVSSLRPNEWCLFPIGRDEIGGGTPMTETGTFVPVTIVGNPNDYEMILISR